MSKVYRLHATILPQFFRQVVKRQNQKITIPFDGRIFSAHHGFKFSRISGDVLINFNKFYCLCFANFHCCEGMGKCSLAVFDRLSKFVHIIAHCVLCFYIFIYFQCSTTFGFGQLVVVNTSPPNTVFFNVLFK